MVAHSPEFLNRPDRGRKPTTLGRLYLSWHSIGSDVAQWSQWNSGNRIAVMRQRASRLKTHSIQEAGSKAKTNTTTPTGAKELG